MARNEKPREPLPPLTDRRERMAQGDQGMMAARQQGGNGLTRMDPARPFSSTPPGWDFDRAERAHGHDPVDF